MKIPIFNTLYSDQLKSLESKKLDIRKLNNLNLMNLDNKKFPLIKILDIIPDKSSLFETILISVNDELVNLFLKKKISFYEISKKLFNFVKLKEFQIYKKKMPKNIKEINKLNSYVRLKVNQLCI